MQAVILAAGMGKRLKQLTRHATKCMVEVNDVSMITRMLHQLEAKHLSRIIMVVGYEAEKLITFVNNLKIRTPIIYIRNEIFDKTNNIYSLYLAKEYLEEEDTILLESDLIFEDRVLDRLTEDAYPSLVLVAKFQSWMDGTVVTLDEEHRIIGMYDKKHFRFEKMDSYYKTVNLYKFSKEFSSSQYIPFLEAYCKAMGHNEYYEQVLKVITMLEQTEIKATCLEDEKWYEIDDIQDLNIAETIFADGEDKLQKMQKAYGGYWRYPTLVDYCYLVNPYYPPKKLLSELKSNMDTLICNYPSGQAMNSLLAAKYFGVNVSNICVGNGAAELIKCLMEYLEGNCGGVSPTFEEYPNRMEGNKYCFFKPSNQAYAYTADDLMEYFEDKNIQNLLLINPDNPSGNYIPYKDVMRIILWCEQREIRLIIDESFADFAEEEKSFITDTILEEHTQVVVVKSISKSYGVPGIRLGVLASGDTELIQYIKKNVAIWNINSLGEFYLQIFEKYEKDYRSSLKKLRMCRNILFHALEEIPGITPIPSQANYIMCKLDTADSKKVCERLLNDYNILIKDLAAKKGFDGQSYIRLAIRTEEENQELVRAICCVEADNC